MLAILPPFTKFGRKQNYRNNDARARFKIKYVVFDFTAIQTNNRVSHRRQESMISNHELTLGLTIVVIPYLAPQCLVDGDGM